MHPSCTRVSGRNLDDPDIQEGPSVREPTERVGVCEQFQMTPTQPNSCHLRPAKNGSAHGFRTVLGSSQGLLSGFESRRASWRPQEKPKANRSEVIPLEDTQ